MKDYYCSVCNSAPCICGVPKHCHEEPKHCHEEHKHCHEEPKPPKHCHEEPKHCHEKPDAGKPENPCTENPELTTPKANKGVFVAAGNGKIPLSVASETDIKFGAELYSAGEIVAHFEDTADFAILKSGEYEIHYQLSAYNPSMEEGIGKPIDITTKLVSSKQGVIDILHFTKEFTVIQKSILVKLDAGEVITLKMTQPGKTEKSVHSEAIVFVRL